MRVSWLRAGAWCLAVLLSAAAPAAGAAARPRYEQHVVALRVARQLHDEDRPWSKGNPDVRHGSAVLVSASLLLTEAKMIHDATLIQVQKRGRADWIPARLVHRDSEIDLAMLTVDEPGFFDDLIPATLAVTSPAAGPVQSVRWRERQLEISSSRVGRMEVRKSPHGSVSHAFLRVTTDFKAAGWAEPVFAGGQLVGLSVAQQEQLAIVTPAEVLGAYVAAVSSAESRSGYRGFASFAALWQVNSDRALASYFGLEGEPRGVFIRIVHRGSTACSGLEPRDIVLELDGHSIDASGNYHHPRYGRLSLHHIVVEGHTPGDVISARVLRGGQLLDVELVLASYPSSIQLIPWRRDDDAPPYLVAGGLVLRELDGRYLMTWGNDWRSVAPAQLRYYTDFLSHRQTPARRRIVILSHVLPAPYNIGYHNLRDLPVDTINGVAIGSVADAQRAFAQPSDGLHRVAFRPNVTIGELVLDATTFEVASAGILRSYEVTHGVRLRESPLPDLGAACAVTPRPGPGPRP